MDANNYQPSQQLRVYLGKEGKFWFAQGLDVDYVSQGKTKKEAQERFKSGLLLTIKHTKEIFGKVSDPVKTAAPLEVWTEFLIPPTNLK